jgi:hypothetical protein
LLAFLETGRAIRDSAADDVRTSFDSGNIFCATVSEAMGREPALARQKPSQEEAPIRFRNRKFCTA